jgi:histidyl-tRNA synthetase
VVQHRNEITFPFKRYQIQPVWRADRPQRGRYREFYQCDVDVIGSDSLLNEYELVRIMDEVFHALGLKTVIRINNRKILAGVAAAIGHPDRLTEITVAIDKLEKTGWKEVLEELKDRGIDEKALKMLEPFLAMKGTVDEQLDFLDTFLRDSEAGQKGLAELRQLFSYLEGAGLDADVTFDQTLARGLDYYTGAIFEVRSAEMEIGSLCGGGRYDDLAGIFGMEGVSGVGVSFGADRIYDVLLQLDRFPSRGEIDTTILFVNFGHQETRFVLPVIDRLRERGIATELYPDPVKMKKQLTYANNRGIPYVAMAGEREVAEGGVTLKEMETGREERLTPDGLVARFTAD